jgi:dCTP deaminase
MKLSDVHVLEKLQTGEIRIDPPPTKQQIGSFSIDLRLGREFRIFKPSSSPYIDLGNIDCFDARSANFNLQNKEDLMQQVYIPEHGAFYLHAGELALGITLERVTLPNDLVGWLDGRSSLARLGLMVHLTAHTIDPGWDGNITLEFVNIGRVPLALRPGMRICAISFEPLTSPSSSPYCSKKNAKYIGQTQPQSANFNLQNNSECKF